MKSKSYEVYYILHASRSTSELGTAAFNVNSRHEIVNETVA
jgi:hypothetical protein